MTKRLLFPVIFYFVSLSFTYAQCGREYTMVLNNNFTFTSRSYDFEPISAKTFACGVLEFKIQSANAENLKFKWYRNDTLQTEKSSFFKSFQAGVFRAEIQDGDCIYKFGDIYIEFIETLPITISTRELIICNQVKSSLPIWVSTNLSYNDIQYQWQKDGKDIPNETSYQIYPQSTGTYTVRATVNTCSSTSLPVTVKASSDNKIRNYLSIDNTNSTPIIEDTLFLCQDNSYILTNNAYTNWFFNGKSVGYNYSFTPQQSGTYYTSSSVGNNCLLESKPVYVSFGKKMTPFKINIADEFTHCDQRTLYLNDKNIRGQNKLTLNDALTGKMIYSFSNINNFFLFWTTQGKYFINYESGSCKNEPQYLDNTSTKRYISSSNGEKIGGKKITLCVNSSVNVNLDYYLSDEVKLFRDGILVQTKPASLHQHPYFNLAKTGKYHFEIISPYCTPVTNTLSDTVEIEVPESITASLTLNSQTCDSKTLIAKAYEGYTYSWYKNNQLIQDANISSLTLKGNEVGSFHAVLQKGFCSVATKSLQIGEKIQGQSTVCQYSKLDLRTSIAEGTYLWKGPNNFSSDLHTIIIDSADAKHAGWYILKTIKNGCSFIDSLEIKVPTKPDLSVKFLNSMCTNKEAVIELKGKPGSYILSYSFYGIQNSQSQLYLSGANESFIVGLGTLSSLPANSNKEYLQLENAGCHFPVSVPIRLSQEACQDILDFINLKSTYCSKEKITLKFNLPKSLPVGTKFKLSMDSYGYTYNLGTFSGNQVYIQLPENVYYGYFILESEDGQHKAFSKRISINQIQPSVYFKEGSFYVPGAVHCNGYSTTIFSSNSSFQKLQWKKDGIDIPGANSAIFEAKDDGHYTLKASFDGCTAESSPVSLTSGEIPKPFINTVFNTTKACKGFSVPLIERGSFPYSDYEWRRNGLLIEKKSGNDIFEAKESGYYSVYGKQGGCENKSDSIWIEIGESISNSIYAYTNTIIQDNKILTCDNLPVTFYSTPYSSAQLPMLNDSLFSQKFGIHFQWKYNNKNIEGAIGMSYSSSKSGIYLLQLKQGDCIINSNSIEVLNQDTLRAKISSGYYNFNNNHVKDIVACQKDSISIYVDIFSDRLYNWNREIFRDGKLIESNSDENSINWGNYYSVSDPGKYSIKLYHPEKKGCIVITDTIAIQFKNNIINLPVDTIYSCNDKTVLNAQVYGWSYEWSYDNKPISQNFDLMATDPGSYKVKIQKTDACYLERTFFIDRKLKPVINKYPDELHSSTICPNDTINLLLGNLNDLEFGF